MLKLTKVIINTNRELIGFMVKGKEKEFGGFSTEVIERGVPTDQIIKTKFSNNQIYVNNNNSIVEKGNFRINQLPMCVYTQDGYIDLDNSLTITGRFVQDNENIGFRVAFADGSENNFRYANVLMLCKWFKPANFAIRTSSKNKQYICGKTGTPLESIPATVIGAEPEVKPKRMKSAAKEKEETVKGNIEVGFDILDIYGFISDCNGCVIKLPSEDYTTTTVTDTETKGFTSLGIGEVASPVPMFNPTKLNVNAGFKKVGIVNVDVNGTNVPVTTFVYRTKNIFYNGENHMKKFGIAVPTDREDDLLSKLGGSLALEKITDSSITSPLGQVIDAKSLSFYTVDASKIDLISKQKRIDSIMSATDITKLCIRLYELKLISKAMGPKGGLMKELKSVLSADDIATTQGKKVFGAFAMYSKEGLEAVSNAGIDIYSGAYTAPGTSSYSGKGSGSSESVEIEYILKGYDAGKITGAKVLAAVKANDTTLVSESVIKAVSEVLKETDLKKQYLLAEKLYKSTEAKANEIGKRFWLHNASMYIEGNKGRIHTHDAKSWSVDGSSKVKTASVYMCNTKGCEGLTIKFKGVTI